MIPEQLVIDGFKTTHTDNFLEEAVAIFGEEKVNNFVEVAPWVLRWYAGLDWERFTDYSYIAFKLEKAWEEMKNV